MMFYNGFNLMIDIVLVTITALYVRYATMRDQKLVSFQELDYEYNQGWEAGFDHGVRNRNNPEIKGEW